MRPWIWTLIAAAGVLLLVWRCPADPTSPAPGSTTAATQENALEPISQPRQGKPSTTSTSSAQPRQGKPSTTSTNSAQPRQGKPSTTSTSITRPALSDATGAVTLRREPRHPEESDLQYEWRTQLVVAFDWFRSESKISEDKEQKLLLLLAQAQEVLVWIDSMRPPVSATEVVYDAYAKWASVYSGRVRGALDEQIELLLTPDEYGAWDRYVADLLIFRLGYAQPLRITSTPSRSL